MVALSVLALAPALVIAWLTYAASSSSMTASVGESFQQSAAGLHGTIDRNLFERYGDVQAFGVNTAVFDRSDWYRVGSAENVVARMANTYVALYGIYTLSIVVDLDGRVIAVNDQDATGRTIDTAAIYATRFADAAWSKNAVAGSFLVQKGSALTGTVVSDVHADEATKRIYGGSGQVISFSAPIRDSQGRMVAVWHNRATFTLVEDIVKATQTIQGNISGVWG